MLLRRRGRVGYFGTQAAPASDRDQILAALSSVGGELYEWSPSTCFQETARSTPAAVGDVVGGVTGPNGNHAFQNTSAQRPTLRQDGSGKHYLEGAGAHHLRVPAMVTGYQHLACFGAAFVTSTGLTQTICTFGNTATATPKLCRLNRTHAGPYNGVATNDANTTSTAASASGSAYGPEIMVLTLWSDGAEQVLRKNGVEIARVAQTSGAVTINFGSLMAALSGTTPVSLMNGSLYPGVIFGGLVDAGMVAMTEAHVASLCGVTI